MNQPLTLAQCGIKEKSTGLFTAFRDYLIKERQSTDNIRHYSAELAMGFLREFLKERGHTHHATYNFSCGYIIE